MWVLGTDSQAWFRLRDFCGPALCGCRQQQRLPRHSQQGEVGLLLFPRATENLPSTASDALREAPLARIAHLPTLESVTGKEETGFETFLTMTHSQKHVLPKISWCISHTHIHTYM